MKLLLIGMSFTLASLSVATPDEMVKFRALLNLTESSRLSNAECAVCHTDPPKHNEFGRALYASMKLRNDSLVSQQTLTSVGSADSDGDGWSNGEELKADFLPGDSQSHPSGTPGESVSPTVDPKTGLLNRLVPKHSFHPTVIHFPIALFLFGAGLELLGWRRKDPMMRTAGFWALLVGTISTALAIPTGLMVFLRNGFTWQGTALIHVALAVSATVLMIATTLWRKKGAHETAIYFALLLLTALIVGTAGHFGGSLVYGS